MIRFRAGNAEYNEALREILVEFVGDDQSKLQEIEDFFSRSEQCELLLGDTLLCG